VGGVEYSSCTTAHTNPGEPAWCATKLDSTGEVLPLVSGSWGYCQASCQNSTAPACPHRTPLGFPASCTARLARQDKRILFLGNSYTYGNDLPAMVGNLASGAGLSATTSKIANGGWTLTRHVANSLGTVRGGDWDAVVIQDQSQRPSFPKTWVYQNILPETAAIVAAVRESVNPCAVPVFFQTWGKRDGDKHNCNNGNYFCSFDGIQDRLTESYSTFAYTNQPARVAPAGEAWRGYTDRASLFAGDGSHASRAGTYLTACTILETIWGVSSVGNSYQPVGGAPALQAAAHAAVVGGAWEWPEAGPAPCPTCLG